VVVADAEDVPSSILEISKDNYFVLKVVVEKERWQGNPFETQAHNNDYIIGLLTDESLR
jgi:hypothetical protein